MCLTHNFDVVALDYIDLKYVGEMQRQLWCCLLDSFDRKYVGEVQGHLWCRGLDSFDLTYLGEMAKV